jgi:uncharacterized membrane-anchored protein
VWLASIILAAIFAPDPGAVIGVVVGYPLFIAFWVAVLLFAIDPSPEGRARRASRRAARQQAIASLSEPLIVNGVTCPSCGRRRAERITIAKKVGAAAVFGLLSIGYASKTFKCQNCHYTW